MSELRTNRIIPRDGLTSGTFNGGGVIQVKHTAFTGTDDATGAIATALTDFESTYNCVITPTRSDSKILIQGNIGGIETSAHNNYGQGILLRDSTVIISAIDYGIGFTGDSARAGTSSSFFILDAPATASAITYKVQFKNAAGSGTVTTQTNSSRSAILLMEISG